MGVQRFDFHEQRSMSTYDTVWAVLFVVVPLLACWFYWWLDR